MKRQAAQRRLSTVALAVVLVLRSTQWFPSTHCASASAASEFAGCALRVWHSRVIAPVTINSVSDPYVFGVINDLGDHFANEWEHGVRATTFELHWMHYEPQAGVYDQDYIASMQRLLATLKAQGWIVWL